MGIQLDQITHLTFDCYGTLIDWETGILRALRSALDPHGVKAAPERLLQLYVLNEARLEAEAWRPYRLVLGQTIGFIGQELGVALSSAEQARFAESLPAWPPFPDTVAALHRLGKRFRLAILSNIDDALFAQTARQLGVSFHDVITAEQVRSYKPAETHFHEALRRLKVPAGNILHVAQSLYHDHVPARRLGFRTAWIERPSLLRTTGLAPSATVQTDLKFSSLAGLADRLE
jgi:2-haloacid dehalogenase